jgi:hypothetical protein
MGGDRRRERCGGESDQGEGEELGHASRKSLVLHPTSARRGDAAPLNSR